MFESFFYSPYRALRLYEKNKNIFLGPYGEISFHAIGSCIKRFNISKDITWVDLGSGRGRLLFWLSSVRKQKKVIGVELYPKWVRSGAQKIQFFTLCGIRIEHRTIIDYLTLPKEGLEQRLFYFYQSSMDDSQCYEIGKSIQNMKGDMILSVSFSFKEYGFENIEIVDTITASFPWGEAVIYYQKIC